MDTTRRQCAAAPAGSLTGEEFGRLLWAAGPAVRDQLRRALSPSIARVADGDDLWQETCLIAWCRRENFEWRGPGPLVQWLATIARRTAHRHARRHARSASRCGLVPDVDAATLDDADITDDPAIEAERRDTTNALHRWVAALPSAQRRVVELDLERQLTAAALARLLGKSVTTIHKHRYRALRSLRQASACGPTAPPDTLRRTPLESSHRAATGCTTQHSYPSCETFSLSAPQRSARSPCRPRSTRT